MRRIVAGWALACMGLVACGKAQGMQMEEVPLRAADSTRVRRTNNRSPVFRVRESDVGFFMNYTGFRRVEDSADGERFLVTEIEPKVLDMIAGAEQHIILSVFLFDSFYAEGMPTRDVVGTVTDALVNKRRESPNIRIAVILDPSHKAYGRRVSPAERRFRENGIDVFYSDLLGGLKKASLLGVREGWGHINRAIDGITLGGWGSLWSALLSKVPIPKRFDGDLMSLESAYNALLLKANHRKLLVVDTPDGQFEVLVSSANPHNASAFHVNSAVSVRGEAATYVFNLLREDMIRSAALGRQYAHWSDKADQEYRDGFFRDRFPALDMEAVPAGTGDVGVTVVTEDEIPRDVIRMLDGVGQGDEVRIQMFYLSFRPVVDALLEAACRTDVPVRLLLDANKDSFNREKDGTPNRQMARHLLRTGAERGADIEVRWYSTHGEQNHAKAMTITNPKTGKYILTTGSCNWTGRNMDGVNMEANVVVDGSSALAARFNRLFDMFWTNEDGVEYSLPYEAFRDQTASDRKWILGEKPYYYSTF